MRFRESWPKFKHILFHYYIELLFSVKLIFFIIKWSPIRDSNSECLITTGSKPVNFTKFVQSGILSKTSYKSLQSLSFISSFINA